MLDHLLTLRSFSKGIDTTSRLPYNPCSLLYGQRDYSSITVQPLLPPLRTARLLLDYRTILSSFSSGIETTPRLPYNPLFLLFRHRDHFSITVQSSLPPLPASKPALDYRRILSSFSSGIETTSRLPYNPLFLLFRHRDSFSITVESSLPSLPAPRLLLDYRRILSPYSSGIDTLSRLP
ncbi:hypothetical protein SAMN05216225_102012 [Ornithinibacillus halophilus]|uniref:Uncharacterized protein n=1 Tax=Ornithinibacillus halophilus TaxID=930117 RepID=A0A1M5HWT0_9BACI|nr:hypothetical protein SAMN05216225_102012 [Ornithinibacillus halophilus]